MKRIGIQGIFTDEDLLDLIDLFASKGAICGLLELPDHRYESIDTAQLDKTGKILRAESIWLNTEPFPGEHKIHSRIGYEFPGSFNLSFDYSRVNNNQIAVTSIGCPYPASGQQLKIWESGLREWKKRLVRDVHVFSGITKKGYGNQKMNVSQRAVDGYDKHLWTLVSPFHGERSDLIHPLASKRPVPFEI